jgi:hypothetical protein
LEAVCRPGSFWTSLRGTLHIKSFTKFLRGYTFLLAGNRIPLPGYIFPMAGKTENIECEIFQALGKNVTLRIQTFPLRFRTWRSGGHNFPVLG